MEKLIFDLVRYGFEIYTIAIFAYILMSWLPNLRQSKFGEILGKIVEPYLSIFRKIIPSIGGIDISPILAIFLLSFIQRYTLEGLLFLFTLI